MDLMAEAQKANLEPYLVEEIEQSRSKGQRNGILLFATILGLMVVIVLLINNFAPDIFGFGRLVLPDPFERLIPPESRNSILFGAAAPLVTAAGRFVDQIAKARSERLTMLFVRYLYHSGDREQATRVLVMHNMRRSGGGGGLFEYIALHGS